MMRDFETLIAEATEADVDGWGFGWLDKRATEERPPWGSPRCRQTAWPRSEAPWTWTPVAEKCCQRPAAFPKG